MLSSDSGPRQDGPGGGGLMAVLKGGILPINCIAIHSLCTKHQWQGPAASAPGGIWSEHRCTCLLGLPHAGELPRLTGTVPQLRRREGPIAGAGAAGSSRDLSLRLAGGRLLPVYSRVCILISSYKDTGRVALGPTLVALFALSPFPHWPDIK